MKNFTYHHAVPFLFALLFLFSCGDKEKETVEPAQKDCRLLQLTSIVDNAGIRFTYDAQGKIARIDPTAQNSSGEYATLEYNSAGKLVKLKNFDPAAELSSYITFAYNTEGLMVKTTDYALEEGKFESLYFSTFEYNAAKQVQKTALFFSMAPTLPWSYDLYSYAANGNVTEVKSYTMSMTAGRYSLLSTSTFTYDNKKNPFYQLYSLFSMGSPEIYSPNNITEVRTTYSGNATTEVDKYLYEYDAQDMIIKQSFESGGQVTPGLSFSYSCQ